ncbi:Zinc finger BED domain-containing protein 1 [Merluccius polli]|uniref:Zinc finger BED domain-containing protein 1 n=1 Tax=Merluccius polli TaxID=89951 RepID=A0AA47NTG8_MERPO|nr:Zinc finger BED domain-containing protein 1 [Merluccius polli]
MKMNCLQTAFFPEDHTGLNIAEGLRQTMAAWDLSEERQVCITTDNASNMKLAAELNGWMRLQCFGHRLHLAIENAMKDHRIGRAMGVCKKVVSAFSYSWKKKRELTDVQKRLNLPEHSLKTECPTRWGSRQAMIGRVLEQQKAIAEVLFNDTKNRHLTPSWQDIDVLEAINKSLSPLVEFTDALFGEQYVTNSPPFQHLHIGRAGERHRPCKVHQAEDLNEKYDDAPTQELLDMASALDPRFKLTYVSEDKRGSIEERLSSEMKTVMVEKAPQRAVTPADDPDAAGAAGGAPKKKKALGSFFKLVTEGTAQRSAALQPDQDRAIASELQSYFQAGTLNTEADPLEWWKMSQNFYPRLSNLARKYLCIPATSASSERVFSTGGNVVTCLRSSLKPDQEQLDTLRDALSESKRLNHALTERTHNLQTALEQQTSTLQEMSNVRQALKRQKEAGLEAQGSAQQHQREREGLQERLSALQVSMTMLQMERGELERDVTRLRKDKTSLRKTLEKVELQRRRREEEMLLGGQETERLVRDLAETQAELQSLQARHSELGHNHTQRLLEASARHTQEMEVETGRLRAAQHQAELALESRERAHRQRVKGLEGQVGSETSK